LSYKHHSVQGSQTAPNSQTQNAADSQTSSSPQAPSAAPTKVLYVATSGSDSNTGTIDRPFKTISAAARGATPGTEILVRAGTYTDAVKISNSGTASANITITPYPGEAVVLDGSRLPAKTDMVSIYGNHVTFKGFDVMNATAHGIIAWATHNVTITDNSVHGSQSGGIWVGGDVAGQSYSNQILNNTVHDNVLRNQSHSASGAWGSALAIEKSDDTQIVGNTVYNNQGEGIDDLLSNNAIISQNTVHDNFSVNIYLDNAPGAIVDRNFIYSTGNPTYFIHGHPAEGIAAAAESYSTQLPLNNIRITNNIDVGDDYGFYYGSYGQGDGMKNALIANNTFVNDGRSALHIEAAAGNSGNKVFNNIFYSATSKALASGSATGSLLSHNLWFGGSHAGFTGSGDVNADPKLASPGSLTPAGYRLLSGSPAAGAGSASSAVSTDFSGASRAGLFSIGAFQP
jgi:parallel beta-helix repeat protein